MGLRPYQQKCLDNVKTRFASGVKRQLIVAATGTGKTVKFANLPKHLDIKGRTLVILHREELADQAAKKIKKWNPDISVGIEMGDNHIDGHEQIIVAGNATLGREGCKRLLALNPEEFELIIIDEAHHSPAESYQVILRHFGVVGDVIRPNAPLTVGVTATPNRPDKKAMGLTFDEIVFNYPMEQAVKDGYLAEPLGTRIKTATDISGVATRAGDFAQDQLGRAVNIYKRNDLVVREWLEQAWTRQTVAYCVDIKHSQDLAEAYHQKGIAAAAVWGDDLEREQKINCHKDGRLKVLTNAQVLTEGYDDWRIGCIVMAVPTKSQLKYIQCVGRGLRIPDDVENLLTARQAGVKLEKEDCIVLDVADVTGKHSLVTLPTLLGLPANLDLKGQSVVRAAEAIQQAQRDHPALNIEELEDITQLKTLVEQVDLFAQNEKFDKEIQDCSQLQWHRSTDGNGWVLILNSKENVCVYRDALDQWGVKGSFQGQNFDEKGKRDISDAILWAELNLSVIGAKSGKDPLTRLRRAGMWKRDPVTPDQKAYLLKHRLAEPYQIETMSKGDAQKLSARHIILNKFRRRGR